MKVEYADAPPGSRCGVCCSRIERVTRGEHRGKFAFARFRDELGDERIAHVTCLEQRGPRLTADFDRWASSDGNYTSARKPAAI